MFKHFGMCRLINGNAAIRGVVLTCLVLSFSQPFDTLAETAFPIPRKMVAYNVWIEIFDSKRSGLDLLFYTEINRADDIIKLLTPITLNGKIVSDESSSKKPDYGEKLSIVLKYCVDFFKHHFYFIAWTVFGFMCGYGRR